MRRVRLRKRLDSDTLYLPELRDMIGEEVEIVVSEEPASAGQKLSKDYSALIEAAGKDLVDPEAYREFRDRYSTGTISLYP